MMDQLNTGPISAQYSKIEDLETSISLQKQLISRQKHHETLKMLSLPIFLTLVSMTAIGYGYRKSFSWLVPGGVVGIAASGVFGYHQKKKVSHNLSHAMSRLLETGSWVSSSPPFYAELFNTVRAIILDPKLSDAKKAENLERYLKSEAMESICELDKDAYLLSSLLDAFNELSHDEKAKNQVAQLNQWIARPALDWRVFLNGGMNKYHYRHLPNEALADMRKALKEGNQQVVFLLREIAEIQEQIFKDEKATQTIPAKGASPRPSQHFFVTQAAENAHFILGEYYLSQKKLVEAGTQFGLAVCATGFNKVDGFNKLERPTDINKQTFTLWRVGILLTAFDFLFNPKDDYIQDLSPEEAGKVSLLAMPWMEACQDEIITLVGMANNYPQTIELLKEIGEYQHKIYKGTEEYCALENAREKNPYGNMRPLLVTLEGYFPNSCASSFQTTAAHNAYFVLSQFYLQQGSLRNAKSMFEQAVRKTGFKDIAALRKPDNTAETVFAQWRTEVLSEAVSYFMTYSHGYKSTVFWMDACKDYIQNPHLLIDMGYQYQAENQLTKAIEVFARAFEKDSSTVKSYGHFLCEHYYQQHQWDNFLKVSKPYLEHHKQETYSTIISLRGAEGVAVKKHPDEMANEINAMLPNSIKVLKAQYDNISQSIYPS
jgi:tetratricopeptide (TPR) repeat protein